MEMQIVGAVDLVNRRQKEWVLEKLVENFKNELGGRTICLWGLAFKPNTDDLRDAPSVHLMKSLFARDVRVRAHDPAALSQIRSAFASEISEGKLKLYDNPYEAAEGADALAVLTEWQEYRTPNFKKLAKLLGSRLIIDGRDIYDPKLVTAAGFKHFGVGLPASV